jgi:hypothetical protein
MWLRERSKRDSSSEQAKTFEGNVNKNRRLRSARNIGRCLFLEAGGGKMAAEILHMMI